MECTLVDYMGSDLSVVNAARVSFDKDSEFEVHTFDDQDEAERFAKETKGKLDYDYVTSEKWYCSYPVLVLSDKDKKLINYLASHNHWTPFSHVQITLREKVPIFVARQRYKHTVGFSYNEVSRRYVSDEPEFYYPEAWRSKPEGSVKQGSGEIITHDAGIKVEYGWIIKECLKSYNGLLAAGVAPEQARMILPQSMFTEYVCTGSLYAFARAYKLRSDSHAQKEIQELAKKWNDIIRPLYPISWSALVD